MARHSEHDDILAPGYMLKGQQIKANYTKQEVSEYDNNPLIEALPPIATKEEVINNIAYYPPYDPEDRKLPNHLRKHKVEIVKELFVPQKRHIEIEASVSCMLRRGYLTRNPIEIGHYVNLRKELEAFQANPKNKRPLRGRLQGMSILGPGGVGKSSAIENILLCYPQVIWHSNYKSRSFILKQLVWLKIDCPKDGSMRGLCVNFFQAIDDILGTTYRKQYAKRSNSVDEMIPDMARVAAIHCLGLFIVDEIQNLSLSKSGGSLEMLNAFVQIENTFHVPHVLIGAVEAISLLTQDLRHARRASEHGDIVMPRMSEILEKIKKDDPDVIDPEWDAFARALFTYNYLKHDIKLEKNLLEDKRCRALYDVSQGIAAVAVTVFVLAQKRAIDAGVEKLTVGVIRSAAKDGQHLIKRYMDNYREGSLS